jgi:hypothetical protein
MTDGRDVNEILADALKAVDRIGELLLKQTGEEVEFCTECERPWLTARERWRSYLTVDGESALYCPQCAEEEFGDG